MNENELPKNRHAQALAAQRREHSHLCAHCGMPFAGLRQARYCSASCRTLAYRKRERQKQKPEV